MPTLVNTLDHPIRVDDDNGVSRRIHPGQPVEVDDDQAKRLEPWTREATQEDIDAWEERNAPASTETSGKEDLEAAAAAAREQARVQYVAVPLNQVVGDDDAPYGPPSGTITTKQAAARESADDRRAFADHERLPEEAENEKLSDVERAQAEAKAVVEELHNEALEAGRGESDDDDAASAEGKAPEGAPLRGQALDDALRAKELSTSGTVAEKQARLAAAE